MPAPDGIRMRDISKGITMPSWRGRALTSSVPPSRFSMTKVVLVVKFEKRRCWPETSNAPMLGVAPGWNSPVQLDMPKSS